MVQLSEDQKKKITEALTSRGAVLPCPRCGNNTFGLVDGYFIQPIQHDLGTLQIGGPSVPAVVVACQRCGFLARHALGTLGLLPPQGAQK